MIDRDKVIELAKKSGATMVFTWSEPPKVDGMDIMLFTKLFIEEVLNADRDSSRASGSDTNPEPEGTDSVSVGGTEEGEHVQPNVQFRRTRKQKTAKENAAVDEESA